MNVLLQRVRQKYCVKFGSKRRDKKQGDGKIGDVMEIFTFFSLLPDIIWVDDDEGSGEARSTFAN